MASNPGELAEQRSDEDVPDPDGEWGWNGGFSRAPLIAGIVSIIALVAFVFGNHQGRVEDIWLFGLAIVLVGGVVLHVVRKRNAWRR